MWNNFVESVVNANVSDYKTSKEYELRHNRMIYIDEMLTTNLTKDEKVLVEEVLLELGTATDGDAVRLY